MALCSTVKQFLDNIRPFRLPRARNELSSMYCIPLLSSSISLTLYPKFAKNVANIPVSLLCFSEIIVAENKLVCYLSTNFVIVFYLKKG